MFGGVRSSSQDAVELPHYVTTWGHSQTTLRGLIEYVQLEKLEGEENGICDIKDLRVCLLPERWQFHGMEQVRAVTSSQCSLHSTYHYVSSAVY